MSMAITLVRWFVIVAWAAWLYFYWRGGSLIISDILSALKTPQTRIDAALLITMMLGTFVVMAASVLVGLGVVDIAPALDVVSLAGAVLALTGIGGTVYSRRCLGRNWAAQTRVGEAHRLVDSGPYRIVRHPIYLFAIMMYIGLVLVFPVWWNGLAVLTINVGYVIKTKDEDEYLKENLPGYQAYASRVTRRLIPWIW